MDVRQIIRDALVRRRWTQRELCRQTGLLPHRVSEYLKGERDIYAGTLEVILKALGLEIRLGTGHGKPAKGVNLIFVVFEDLGNATETKVHKDVCPHYLNRKRGASTTRWHGPFKTFDEAASAARSIAEQKSLGATLHPTCCWRN